MVLKECDKNFVTTLWQQDRKTGADIFGGKRETIGFQPLSSSP